MGSQKISMLYGGFATATTTSGAANSGVQAQDRLGYSLAEIGDVDGDGIVDLLAGADGDDDGLTFDESDRHGAGAVHILFLQKDGTVRKRQKISNTQGGLSQNLAGCSACTPLADNDGSGQSAAALGDFDGDGIPDAMVGAPGAGSGGKLFMLFFNRDGIVKKAASISATEGGFLAASGDGEIGPNDACLGRGLALLGNLDEDGKNEIAVGSYGEDTSGAFWILRVDLDSSLQCQIVKKLNVSSNGTGRFPLTISAGLAGDQQNTEGAQFGHER